MEKSRINIRDRFVTGLKRFPVTIVFALVMFILTSKSLYSKDVLKIPYGLDVFYNMMRVSFFGLAMSLIIGIIIEKNQSKKILYILYLVGFLMTYFIYSYLNETYLLYESSSVARLKFKCLVFAELLVLTFAGVDLDKDRYEIYCFKLVLSLVLKILICLIVSLIINTVIGLVAVITMKFHIIKLVYYVVGFIFTLGLAVLLGGFLPRLDEDYTQMEISKITQETVGETASILILILTVIIFLMTNIAMIFSHKLDGVVLGLVIFYSILGVKLLFFKSFFSSEKGKLGSFMKYYPIANILILLLTSPLILLRVFKYGITINRYMVLASFLWFLLVDIYYLIFKNEKSIFIPVSLSLIIIVSIFGPINMSRITIRSQNKKLEKLLVKNEILENGKFTSRKEVEVDYENLKSINSTIIYLIDKFGMKHLTVLDKDEILKLSDIVIRKDEESFREFYDDEYNREYDREIDSY